MTERQKALQRVQIAQFALHDAALFLDTHPRNKKALAYYSRYQQQLTQAVADYQAKFGPLVAAHAADLERWQWIDGPWPWEGESDHVGV